LRVVGAMAHNGGAGAATNDNTWFPFTLSAVKVPAGMTATAINLFSGQAVSDLDQLFRMDTVCDAASNTDAIPNWHMIDRKAKRKFEVGDKISWIVSLIRPLASAFHVDFSMNLRFLWQLK
jgi:hypothetical protein